MATTVASVTSAAPGGGALERERELAAAIAGHRAARRDILARAHATKRSDDAVARQLEDALADLRRLEAEFARFRASSRAQIEAARAENARLAQALAEATATPKPFEKELSVSKLQAAAADSPNAADAQPMPGIPATTSGAAVQTRDRARRRANSNAEPRWRPFSRNRSAPPTAPRSAANASADPLRAPVKSATASFNDEGARGSSGSGGLFKRNSFSFSLASRSTRPSDSTRSRPASAKWSMCF